MASGISVTWTGEHPYPLPDVGGSKRIRCARSESAYDRTHVNVGAKKEFLRRAEIPVMRLEICYSRGKSRRWSSDGS